MQMLHSFFLMFLCLTLLHYVMDLLTLYENIADKIYCLLEHQQTVYIQNLLTSHSCFCYGEEWAKLPKSQCGPLSE